MLRNGSSRPLHWADKTMSVMRADLLEACEKDLAGLPSHCLFDSDCSDVDAESFYELSFFAEEDRRLSGGKQAPVLHTVEQLRTRVLHQYAQEAALLSVEEHDLLVRTVLFGGRTPLTDWNELLPARGLARRLWCRVEGQGGASVLVMPLQLCSSALLLLASDSHKKVRELVEQVHESIDNTLYLLGAVQAAAPVRHMESLLKDTFVAGRRDLFERFLRVGYDYVYDHSGKLLLIHPGLAEPERMMDYACAEMDPETLSSASDSVGDVESPLYEQMLSLLLDVTRPEIAPEDAVEDLILLAKQEAPYADMEEVLSSLLICQVTPDMRRALREISNRVPRWLTLGTSRVQ